MEIGHFREHIPIDMLPGEALMSISRLQPTRRQKQRRAADA
jgi:hypothetical protein